MKFWRKLGYLFLTTKPLRALTHIDFFLGIIVMLPYRNVDIGISIVLFVSFLCFYAAVFQLNEIIDLSRDREDPARSIRPLASGKVSVREVALFAGILMCMSIALAVIARPAILLGYVCLLVINLLYVGILKRFAYLDIIVVSSTRAIKLVLGGMVVTTTGLISVFPLLPVFTYATILCFHANKQYIRLIKGRLTAKRTVGTISPRGLNIISVFSLVLASAVAFTFEGTLAFVLWGMVLYEFGHTIFFRLPRNTFVTRLERWASTI